LVEYKTTGEIDAMHAAGQVLARILAALRDQAAPGIRLAELDATARDVLAEARAASPFLGYQPTPAHSPFPAVICASVNDAVLHDIPGRYRLKDGDCSASTAAPPWTAGPPTPRSPSRPATRARKTPASSTPPPRRFGQGSPPPSPAAGSATSPPQ
jgi:hypothetical protein